MASAKILVVEDEGIVALYIKNTLKFLGYEVTAIASSGEEAINHAKRDCPDLILMDIRLKGPMDGIEASKRIRADRNIPVIFLTAQTDDDTVQRVRMSNPSGFLTKPFEQQRLQEAIEHALEARQHG